MKKMLMAMMAAALGIALFIPSYAYATPTKVQEATSKLNALYDEASAANEELNATNVLIDQTNAKIADLNTQLQTVQSEIASKQTELAQKQAELSEVMRLSYEEGNTTIFDVIFNSRNFDELVSGVYYINKVNTQKAQALNATKALENELNTKNAELSASKQNLEAQKAQQTQLANQQSAKKSALDKKVADTKSYVNSLDAETRKEAEKNAGNSNNDNPQPAPNPKPTPSPTPSPTPPSSARQKVVSAAYSMIGASYVYGACDPVGRKFDCSGFTMWCFSQAGISLPHSSGAQQGMVSLKTDMSQWQSGDLIFWSGHVAIYVGNGMMIDAGTPATGVSCRRVQSNYYGAGWPA